MTIRVLVADDSEDMRELLRASLHAYGDFEVVGEAATGAEAVELTRTMEPEVVILDLSMPVMGGLAALPAIREAAPGTRVVVLSAYSKDEFEDAASRLGAQAYGVKGMHPKAVAALVEQSVSDGRPRVLVVEEASGAWGAYTSAIQVAGNVVTVAASVREAIALVTYRNFELMVLGIRLSDGSGLDVLQALSSMDPAMPVPVAVTLSSEVDPAAANRAFELGAVACLSTRGSTPEEIARSVGQWLDRGEDLRSTCRGFSPPGA
jgi:DNA-binding NarL/FixJ family response regulator